MAHAWKACWVKALGGSNPPSSAGRRARHPQRCRRRALRHSADVVATRHLHSGRARHDTRTREALAKHSQSPPSEDEPMKNATGIVLGVLLVAVGVLFTLQGLGYAKGSAMTGVTL